MNTKTKEIYLAGGCFWGTEHSSSKLKALWKPKWVSLTDLLKIRPISKFTPTKQVMPKQSM